MAWIESHTVLLRHRKLIELARELRLKPVHVLGHLHALWHVALEQQEDGDLSSWSDDLIAEMSCYPGDAPQYVSLLHAHGWLDGKLIHDWLDYAGKYLTAKYRTANPKRLRQILFKHKSVVSRSTVGRSPIGLGRQKVGSEKEGESEGEKSPLPGWLNPETWDKFRQHREAMFKDKTGKRLTPYAEKTALSKLQRLREAGNNPEAVIQQSIESTWSGLFALNNGSRPKSGSDETKRKIESALKRGL